MTRERHDGDLVDIRAHRHTKGCLALQCLLVKAALTRDHEVGGCQRGIKFR